MLTAHKAGLIAELPYLMLQDLSQLLWEVKPPDQVHQETNFPALPCGRGSQRPYKPFSGKKCYSVFSKLMSQTQGPARSAALQTMSHTVVSLQADSRGSERRAAERSRESPTVTASAVLLLQCRRQHLSLPLRNPHQFLHKW